jgi:beta-glucosidase
VRPLAPASSANAPLCYEVSFDVSNTGRREGADVAEVYVGESHPAIPRPQRELKGFTRVSLRPGATERVKVVFDNRAFAYFDTTAHVWRVDPGEFTISVGRSVDDTQLSAKVSLSADQAKAGTAAP